MIIASNPHRLSSCIYSESSPAIPDRCPLILRPGSKDLKNEGGSLILSHDIVSTYLGDVSSHPQRHKSLAKLQNLNRIASICKKYFMKMEQSL